MRTAVEGIDAFGVEKSLLLEKLERALCILTHRFDDRLGLRAKQAHMKIAAREKVFNELFLLTAQSVCFSIGQTGEAL